MVPKLNPAISKGLILIYEGKLAHRIKMLKIFSSATSVATAGVYGNAVMQHGTSKAIAITGAVFVPFLFTPLFITMFFRRYVNSLYYDPTTDEYLLRHYGLFVRQKELRFSRKDVRPAELSDVLSKFRIGNKTFFIEEEDLVDLEAVSLYKKMINLDGKELTESKLR